MIKQSPNMSQINQFFRSECEFKFGAAKYEQIPDSKLVEIAFIGRSNVGKSSLINSVLQQKIAITSKTPGRTRQLNFFCLNNKINIVDMPGFGYAKVSKKEIANWEMLIYEYFAKRNNLKKVFLLIDARRGIGKNDLEVINMFNAVATSYQIILTKTDELKKGELEKVLEETTIKSKKFAAQHPTILTSSSKTNFGIDEIKKSIFEIL